MKFIRKKKDNGTEMCQNLIESLSGPETFLRNKKALEKSNQKIMLKAEQKIIDCIVW